MLNGKSFRLRPIHPADLETLYAFHIEIGNRGEYYPRGVMSHAAFTRTFQESGYWTKEEGWLVIVNEADEIIGHVEFFKTVNYLDEFELSYLLYKSELRGKGIMTEAVDLVVHYLFETKKINRIRLVIHPDNLASRHVAEACGFTHEGFARGAWYNAGKHHDVAIYSILHDEVIS
jgi:RimJ/RimL family protein N-acetyltransferase